MGGGYGGMGGGYGGYGGMYGGMGMGMGRYGMMNRMGGMGGGNSQFEKTMEYLDTLGYAVNSLCEIARMVEMNAEGMIKFGVSLIRMFGRIKDWNIQLLASLKAFIIKLFGKLKLLMYILLRRKPP
jgi:peroxin-13